MKKIKDPLTGATRQMSDVESPKQDKKHSNFLGGLLTGLTSAASGLAPDGGACFGNKACQEDRAKQTEANLTNAQTLADAEKNKVTLIVIGAITVVVLAAVAAFVFLKKENQI